MVDFSRYMIRAKIGLGQWHSAEDELKVYEARALLLKSKLRMSRAAYYRQQIRVLKAAQRKRSNLSLVVDTDKHLLRIHEQIFDLSSTPLIEHLYAILVRAGQPMALSVVFEKLYGVSYRPEAHEARFKTLIDRARKLCPFAQVIKRRGGSIELSKEFAYSIKSSNDRQGASNRQDILITLLRNQDGALTASDILKISNIPKRTLQADLKQLVEQGVLRRKGYGRVSRYEIERA